MYFHQRHGFTNGFAYSLEGGGNDDYCMLKSSLQTGLKQSSNVSEVYFNLCP